jgi:zinc transport system substrate-binding protein
MTGGRWTLRGTVFCAFTGRLTALGVLAVAFLMGSLPAGARAGEVDVVVTIKPIHSLVARVMEGVATPLLLVEGNASPHSFALRPSQVQAVDNSAVLVRVSERLEPFTGKLVRALPAGVQLVSLVDAPGLKLLDQRYSGTFEPHAHGVDEDDHAGIGDHGRADSHIWLDPDNAKAIGSYVASVLSARFPEYAERFKQNAEHLRADIDALTTEIATATEPLRHKPFVVFHDAYQYFDRRFELDAVGSITITPDVQPSAKRLIELRRKIRELNAVCVFAEPLFQPRLVAALIEDTPARAGTLDPEGLGLMPGPQLYFILMRNLAANLKSCLSPAT